MGKHLLPKVAFTCFQVILNILLKNSFRKCVNDVTHFKSYITQTLIKVPNLVL